VGVIMTPAMGLLPRAISRSKLQAPKLRIGVHMESSKQLLDMLQRGSLDFMIGRILEDDSAAGLHYEELTVEPACAVARVGHPLLKSDNLKLADLADQRQRMILSIFSFKCDYSGEMAGFLQRQQENKAESRQIMIECFSAAQRSGDVAKTYAPEFLARTHFDYISGVLNEHLRRNEPPLTAAQVGQVLDFYFGALPRN
jgi:DNA-binding transcriptional LysR family regulator